MKLEYRLTEKDYVQYLLFIASKNDMLKRQRMIVRLIGPVLFTVVGLATYCIPDHILSYTYIIIGIIWYLSFPLWGQQYLKKVLTRIYTRLAKKHYGANFDSLITIAFESDDIQINSITGESKIYLPAITTIIETEHYFYPAIKTGGHLLIPKSEVNDLDEVKNELTELSRKLNINYVSELNWKWK